MSPLAAKPKASESTRREAPSALKSAERALGDFERRSAGKDTATEPTLALERAELLLNVLEATTEDDVTTNAERDGLEARLADVKLRLEHARRPKGGAKPAEKGRVAELEKRYERARQRGIVLLGEGDMGSMGATRVAAETRPFETGLTASMEQRAATLKKQLATVKLPELVGDAARLDMNIRESLRAANSELGQLALGRIQERTLGSTNQPLTAACKRFSKPDLLWRLRLAETVVRSTIPKGYSPSAAFEPGSVPDDEKSANEALTIRVLAAATEVRAQKTCAPSSALPGVPPELSALGEASLVAQLSARQAARDAALALPRVMGLDQARDAWQKKLKPLRAEVEKKAAAAKAAEKKFQTAVAQTKSAPVSLDALVTAQTAADEAAQRGQALLPELAQLRASEDELARDLTTAAAAGAELKVLLATARTDTGKLRSEVTKLGQPNGKEPARDAALLAAKANLARAEASLKDATAAATAAERDWGKARQLAELGPVKDLPSRKAKLDAQDGAFRALIAEARAREKGADGQRNEALAKGSPAGCNLGRIAWDEVGFPEKTTFGEGEMGGASVAQVDYADTDGNGAYEAFVFWHGTTSGTAGGDFSQLAVFELDAKCKPKQIGYADGGLFATPTLKGKTYRIDSAVRLEDEPTCCPSGSTFSEYRVVAGKLKQTR